MFVCKQKLFLYLPQQQSLKYIMENSKQSMSGISRRLKPSNSTRNDPNYLKPFQQLENEYFTAIRGHKNQTIIFFTFKR